MISIRIPLIPGYNTVDDIEASKQLLRRLGFIDEQFEVFQYETDGSKILTELN